MKNNNLWLIAASVLTLQAVTIMSGFAMAADSPSAEAECRRNPPGLRPSDMIAAGFVVHQLEDGSYTYVRLDYVYPDRIYYRHGGNTWRALYLAHPNQVIRQQHGSRPVICAYVIGFRIDQRDKEDSTPSWLFFHDVNFVETP